MDTLPIIAETVTGIAIQAGQTILLKMNLIKDIKIYNMKKRKYIEVNDNQTDIQKKFLKVNKKSEPRVIIYKCYKHDHDKNTCQIYDCEGLKFPFVQEELTKYYLS